MTGSTRYLGWTILCVLFSLSGCATTLSPEKFEAYLKDPKAPRLAVQICLPNRKAFFDDVTVDVTDMPDGIAHQSFADLLAQARKYGMYFKSPRSTKGDRVHQITRMWRQPTSEIEYAYRSIAFGTVENVASVMSAGSGHVYLADSTESDQVVFFDYTHTRPSDVLALSVTTSVDRDGKAVFKEFWFKLPQGDIKEEPTRNGFHPFQRRGVMIGKVSQQTSGC